MTWIILRTRPANGWVHAQNDLCASHATENVVDCFPVPWDRQFTADSRFAPSQWETPLLCNGVSHWLGASPKSALVLGGMSLLAAGQFKTDFIGTRSLGLTWTCHCHKAGSHQEDFKGTVYLSTFIFLKITFHVLVSQRSFSLLPNHQNRFLCDFVKMTFKFH